MGSPQNVQDYARRGREARARRDRRELAERSQRAQREREDRAAAEWRALPRAERERITREQTAQIATVLKLHDQHGALLAGGRQPLSQDDLDAKRRSQVAEAQLFMGDGMTSRSGRRCTNALT